MSKTRRYNGPATPGWAMQANQVRFSRRQDLAYDARAKKFREERQAATRAAGK